MTYGNPFDVSKKPAKLKVLGYNYHRNGSRGAGFFVIDFSWNEKDSPETKRKTFRAIIFTKDSESQSDDGTYLMIITHYSVTSENIQETWAGQHFIDDLATWMSQATWHGFANDYRFVIENI